MRLLEQTGSVSDSIRLIAKDIFKQELDDDKVNAIIGRLKLSDVLELNSAYGRNDMATMAKLLDIKFDLKEYSMGQQVTSMASTRPQPQMNKSASPISPKTISQANNPDMTMTQPTRYSGASQTPTGPLQQPPSPHTQGNSAQQQLQPNTELPQGQSLAQQLNTSPDLQVEPNVNVKIKPNDLKIKKPSNELDQLKALAGLKKR